MWLFAPNIESVHGFSTRLGGVSQPPFQSLNLGGSDDQPENIANNRSLALERLQLRSDQVASLKQVHGTDVRQAKQGIQEGDALVTNKTGMALAISIADCYPILLEDTQNGVIGAAHAGWRGTLGHIAAATIDQMEKLGAKRSSIKAAIGQGISVKQFEVGNEVLSRFVASGFPSECYQGTCIDLLQCNKFVLQKSGILPQNIWSMNRCTFEQDFFSYRRDKGVTGRMWAVIALR